jgi:outer membrane protein OmpA-like peptidoglycan-associated protein
MDVTLDRRRFGRTVASALLLAPLAACVGQPYGPPPLIPPFRRFSIASDVLFAFGSAQLLPGAAEALAGNLYEIRQVYPYPAIQVIGYTDSIGSDAANDQLSLRRAEAVRAWLLSAGIPGQYISVEGMGKRNPVAPNTFPNGADNPAGRAQNRRVELVASRAM